METKRLRPLVALVLLVMVRAVPAFADAPASPPDPAVGKKVQAFTATTLDVKTDPPQRAAFDSAKVTKTTAYIFVGTGCPATNAYAERFSQLAATYSAKGIDIVYLYPNRDDTPEAKITFHKSKQLGGRLIDDQGGAIAHLFDAHRTTEIFLAKADGTIVFHGAVDDSREAANVKQRYFAPAADELLAGKPVTVSSSPVFA
jgi:hypothetical protein